MTAVEWLINQLHKKQYGDYPELSYNKMFDQAKEMEKQQIIDAVEDCNYGNGNDYYNETYGSKGSDEHIVDTNEMVSSQTEIAMIIPEAISILKIHQKWRLGADIVMIEPKELTKALDVLINYHTDIMNETLSSQTEISDEEIMEAIDELLTDGQSPSWEYGFEQGAKWYREQLKQL